MSALPVRRWPARMVELAARLQPPAHRQRYAREFIAELHGMSGRRQLQHATQVLAHAWALRTAIAAAGSTAEETTMIATSRPLKCRLRLHAWEEQENPETRERYEICLRCNAYRDRPRAAPGAGAAGMIGSGPV